MPKQKMYSLKRVQYCAALAVTKFSLGDIVVAEVEGLGKASRDISEKRETKQKLTIKRKEGVKEERRK